MAALASHHTPYQYRSGIFSFPAILSDKSGVGMNANAAIDGSMAHGPDCSVHPFVAPRWPPGVSMAPTIAQAAIMALQFCVELPACSTPRP